MLRNNRGQSTVEYIILVTAVIGVMIVFATNKDAGLQQKLSNAYDQVGNDMATKADSLSLSHDTEDGGVPASGTPDTQFKVDPGTMPDPGATVRHP